VAAAALGLLSLPALAALNAQEEAGKRLYQEGIGASGKAVTAAVGADATRVPGNIVPCANCHGIDGLGRPEGAVVPAVITWSELSKPYGHLHENGRRHPKFDDASFARAVTEGVDPAGQVLERTMPRYALGRDDIANLTAYIKRLEHDGDPGVHADRLRVGTLLPLRGPLAEVGTRTRRVLEGVVADLNAEGGLFGRRVELVVADAGDNGADALKRGREMLAGGDVLALVAPIALGAEREIAKLAEEHKVPVVGLPAGAYPGASPRYTFAVQPGLREQVRTLVTYAARWPETDALTVVESDAPGYAPLAAAVREECEQAGCKGIAGHRYAAGRFDAAAALAAHRKGALLFIGPEADLAALLSAADARKTYPFVLVPGSLGARAASQAPEGFDGRVLLATPALADDTLGAGGPFEGFRKRHKLDEGAAAAQIGAYASAVVLTEGLRRSGKGVGREKLVASLESLRNFATGVAPPLTYGPSRRTGAQGGYVVALDARNQRFRPLTPWLPLD
jgi:ABC-type branched-subunit amino acid transport system substrate-binding protein